MERWFNTAGPCVPEDHYMIPPLRRLPEVPELVRRRAYFVVHAPRQTGKTTAIRAFAKELAASATALRSGELPPCAAGTSTSSGGRSGSTRTRGST